MNAWPKICAGWIADEIYHAALQGIDKVQYV